MCTYLSDSRHGWHVSFVNINEKTSSNKYWISGDFLFFLLLLSASQRWNWKVVVFFGVEWSVDSICRARSKWKPFLFSQSPRRKVSLNRSDLPPWIPRLYESIILNCCSRSFPCLWQCWDDPVHQSTSYALQTCAPRNLIKLLPWKSISRQGCHSDDSCSICWVTPDDRLRQACPAHLSKLTALLSVCQFGCLSSALDKEQKRERKAVKCFKQSKSSDLCLSLGKSLLCFMFDKVSQSDWLTDTETFQSSFSLFDKPWICNDFRGVAWAVLSLIHTPLPVLTALSRADTYTHFPGSIKLRVIIRPSLTKRCSESVRFKVGFLSGRKEA